MSYLVLARKYRPATFSEVVGQEHVTRTLANAFVKDRVHHAFLFCGPRGVGKTTLARILGKALNCEHGPTAEPCGKCAACVSINNGSAVDYYEMDGASNRGIDSIRELTEAVRYQPAVLRKKVYVIDEVHMLTTEAFNALLKTLEEPPPHVSFVLATTEPHKVPNTILSRCQRYDFKLVPTARLSAHLARIFESESLHIEPGAIALIVRESGGSVRDALSLCDQVISFVGSEEIRESAVAEVLGVADRALTRNLVSALARGDAGTALEAVTQAVERGVDEVQLARAIVRYLRDIAVLQVAPKSEALIDGSAEELAELSEQAGAIERSRVTQMFERMIRACDDLGQTQQPRLVLDLALIEVAALEPLVPLGHLIERLGELERRLAGGNHRRGGGGGPAAPRHGSGGQQSRRRPNSGPQAAPTQPDPVRSGPPPAPPPPELEAPAAQRPPTPISPGAAVPFGSFATSLETSADRARKQHARAPESPDSISARTESPHPSPAPESRASPANGSAANGITDSARPARPAQAGPPPFVPGDTMGEWSKVIDAMYDSRKLSLARLYESAKLLSWTAEGIALGASSDEPSARENVQELKEFLLGRYQRPLPVSVRALSPDEAAAMSEARSAAEMARQQRIEERKKREDEVRLHPIYNKLIDTFGTPVKEEITTDV